MTRFVVRRGILGLANLFIVSVLIFIATQALPGDAAAALLGRNATPQNLAILRSRLHLDEPLITQYAQWLGGVLTGHLGTSLANGYPIAQLIGNSLVNSGFLMLIAAVIGVPVSIALGVLSGYYRDTRIDHVSSVATLVLAALPEFVVAVGLIFILAIGLLHILPAVSYFTAPDRPWDHLDMVVLPATTLALGIIPYVGRLTRASIVEVLESDYIVLARLKGLPEGRVIWTHALVNAIAPALQGIGISVAYLLGGVVIVESVFRYPGIGTMLVDAVSYRDLPVIQALALLIAAFRFAVYIAADFATIVVTPKLRTRLL